MTIMDGIASGRTATSDGDMASAAPDRGDAGAATSADLEFAMMERNGITRVPADQFHVDGYRYSNLADALAQVKRGAGARAES